MPKFADHCRFVSLARIWCGAFRVYYCGDVHGTSATVRELNIDHFENRYPELIGFNFDESLKFCTGWLQETVCSLCFCGLTRELREPVYQMEPEKWYLDGAVKLMLSYLQGRITATTLGNNWSDFCRVDGWYKASKSTHFISWYISATCCSDWHIWGRFEETRQAML